MDAVSAKPVVVGVDGSPVNRSAVLWAADEASRCNLPLVLVHAGFYLYEPVLSDATMNQALHEIDEHARTLLRRRSRPSGRWLPTCRSRPGWT